MVGWDVRGGRRTKDEFQMWPNSKMEQSENERKDGTHQNVRGGERNHALYGSSSTDAALSSGGGFSGHGGGGRYRCGRE